MGSILEWGRPPKLVFENEEEFYRTLGQLTNEKAFTISFEPNKKTGSYSNAYRIRILAGTKNVTQALQKKMRTSGRVNCNEYIEYLIKEHSFVQSGNSIMCKFEKVLVTVPEKYKLIFIQGYNEVTEAAPNQVYYATDSIDISQAILKQKPIPRGSKQSQSSVRKQGKQGKRDYIKNTINNYEIGEAGERIVYEHEQKKLNEAFRTGKITDLKDKLEWISRTDDSVGYDIRSYDVDRKEEIYIEVKTTTGNAVTPFYMSENEIIQSKKLGEQYYLYRLYNMNRHKPESVDYFILQGDIGSNPNVTLEKQDYRVVFGKA